MIVTSGGLEKGNTTYYAPDGSVAESQEWVAGRLHVHCYARSQNWSKIGTCGSILTIKIVD
jgi:hypothetical protein